MWKMSAPRIIVASLPSFCQNYQNWWIFDKVLTKTILHSFFETRCIAVIIFEIRGVTNLQYWALRPADASSGKFLIPEKRIGAYLSVCVNFQLSSSNSFRDIRGSQIYTRGVEPSGAPRENFYTRTPHLTLTKCAYNLNILAVTVSEI